MYVGIGMAIRSPLGRLGNMKFLVHSVSAPITALSALPLTTTGATLVTDIVATAADGGPINLMAQTRPASVAALQGGSRP